METNSKNKQQFNIKNYCLSFYSYPKYNQIFGKDTTKTDNPTIQTKKNRDKNYPYKIQDTTDESPSNMVMLTPAIFGGIGAFMVGFLLNKRRWHKISNREDEDGSGRCMEKSPREPYKLEFFLNILSLIALLGATAYIFEEIRRDGGIRKFAAVLPTVVIIIFLFASEDLLIYSVCYECYEGVVGKSSLGDFMNFVALSIGAISVGESYGITPMTTGTKLLLAQESLFNLFVLALLISFVVGEL